MTKYCKCGCGTLIADDKTYVHGHNRKGKPSPRKGKTHTKAAKKKMSESKKGKPSTFKGKHHTEKAKEKLREANLGKPSPLKGKPSPLKSIPRSEKICEHISATKQKIPYDEWEGFACEKKYCPKFDEACRESNRAKYGYRCFMCNKPQSKNTTKTGKVRKLSVHHVDMDKAQGCESNWKLVPLCMDCHATTHNDELIARLGYLIKGVKI